MRNALLSLFMLGFCFSAFAVTFDVDKMTHKQAGRYESKSKLELTLPQSVSGALPLKVWEGKVSAQGTDVELIFEVNRLGTSADLAKHTVFVGDAPGWADSCAHKFEFHILATGTEGITVTNTFNACGSPARDVFLYKFEILAASLQPSGNYFKLAASSGSIEKAFIDWNGASLLGSFSNFVKNGFGSASTKLEFTYTP